jgi:carbon storage regulator CsrA
MMLVLSRKEGERVSIGDNVTLVISKISGNRVTIGIEAPRNVKVVRGELDVTPADFGDLAVSVGTASEKTDMKAFVTATTAKLRHVG